MRMFILLAGVALAACSRSPADANASANAAGPSASAAAPAAAPAAPPPAPRPGQRGPLVAVAAGTGGACGFRFEGAAVSEAQLLDRGAAYLKTAVDRLGGPARITEETMPVLDMQVADDVSYRCAGAALMAMVQSGFATVRIDDPQPRAEHWVLPLVLTFAQDQVATPPPVEPVRNRIGLDAGGAISWNGDRINLMTLRQYGDYAQTMNPVPVMVIETADATPWGRLRPLLTVLSRSHAARVELKGARLAFSLRGRPAF
jgi:hypothetical protein